ncbi:MAG: S8 family peptidase [Lentimonas sp.]
MRVLRPVLIICALAIFGGICGYLLSKQLKRDRVEANVQASADSDQTDNYSESVGTVYFPTIEEPEALKVEYPRNSIKGELVMHFSSRADYAAYLKALASAGLSPLGQIDELMVVRVKTGAALAINTGEFELTPGFSYEVTRPLPPIELSPEAMASLKGFSQSAREIVGDLVDGDGEGVLVAILDSGIQEHAQFDDVYIVHIDLVGYGVDGAGAAHGTSVASIIAGSEGIAPKSELLVVRVLDNEGIGNSYHVAEGIVQATVLGAQIINMSIAVYQDSAVLRQAISYAHDKGVLLVAAAGNDGYTRMPFPADYKNVISVTAIDASGRQALFPNQSKSIDIAAPGVAILTAKEDQGTTLFTGTSAAAPFVSGTLAALISVEHSLAPKQVVDLVKSYLNDAGSPGEDSAYGDGIIDWDRLRERNTPGILDLSIADIHLDPSALPGTTMPIEITVQNRGTMWSTESDLDVIIGEADPVTFTVGSLGPGLTTTRKVYTAVPTGSSEDRLNITARILPEDLNADVRLENNFKGAYYQAK